MLTPNALEFIGRLHREFEPVRQTLLQERHERAQRIIGGETLGFLDETRAIRDADWRVADTPADLQDRRVEITGPVDRKMMINALNSGAKVFMADFEDSLSPTWDNVMEGQVNVMDAVRRRLSFTSPEGKQYALNPTTATLIIRPRGWHLTERHVTVDGTPVSASLFDFGLTFFHNAKEQLARGTGPYFYLPKLQGHREARLWNDVFRFSQDALGVPQGSVRATVLIETIFGAFEMEEILYELRDYMAGLNAGRWDYLFSIIKTFRTRGDLALPDRAQLTMAVPFMRAYTQLLVRTCHKRGAHAIGGMAAFIPSRKDAKVNETALAKVREDKKREAGDGFDGTWVAHPDLVPVAQAEFDRVFGNRKNQKDKLREDVKPNGEALLGFHVDGGQITPAGLETNIDVGLRYIESWLRGQGAAAIHNLMEDAATAEISRSQLWQWVKNRARLEDGGTVTAHVYGEVRDRVLANLRQELGGGDPESRLNDAVKLLDRLVLGEFEDFLTVPGYEMLD